MAKVHRSDARGFTLVELLIAVAIIGLLAALAIPNFERAVLRSRRAEATLNLDGMATAEIAYNSAFDTYVACSNNPGGAIGKRTRPWNPAITGWSAIDYSPAGAVRCNYIVELFGSSTQVYFRATANCDVDDDNLTAIIRRYGPEYTGDTWRDVYPGRY